VKFTLEGSTPSQIAPSPGAGASDTSRYWIPQVYLTSGMYIHRTLHEGCTNVTDDRQTDRQTTLQRNGYVTTGKIACARANSPLINKLSTN